jgi:ABC-type nitrate/sulfonate/bicarbonate transport system permease component
MTRSSTLARPAPRALSKTEVKAHEQNGVQRTSAVGLEPHPQGERRKGVRRANLGRRSTDRVKQSAPVVAEKPAAEKQERRPVYTPAPAVVFGAYRIDQEVEKLLQGQAHSIEVLASRAADDRRAVETSLLKALQSNMLDEDERRRARHALEEYGFVARQSATLLLANDAYERTMAARVLGQVRSAAALPFLLEALHDPEQVVCTEAVAGLGALGLPAAIGALLDLARKGQLWVHVVTTLQRVAVGFTVGAVLALGLGLLAGQLRAVRGVVEPVVELLRPIPPLAMLPLFIVWIGIGEASKIGFITYATFFPMFLTTVHGVAQIDARLLRAAQSLGARPRHLFLRVILPAALPDVLTSLRLGVALSFFVIVISEFVGAENGLGYLINDGRNFFLVPQMLAAALLLGLLGYAGNGIVRLLERRVLRWQHPR